MLLIGSRAMQAHFKDFPRAARDTDWICTIEDFEKTAASSMKHGKNVSVYPTSPSSMVVKSNGYIAEYSIAWPGSTNETILKEHMEDSGVASPELLLLLKLSHRYRKDSPHFLKTMRDIQFLRNRGVCLPEAMLPLLRARERETYSYKHPNLNQKKSDFFNNANGLYRYEHDDIHRAVSVLGPPAYTYFSADGEEVKSDRDKFFSCDESIRLRAGLEESYVLALERSLIPLPGVLTPKKAFDKALEKVCTSITSGWFREYCWENYDRIQSMYDESFVGKFNRALERGEVRKYEEHK